MWSVPALQCCLASIDSAGATSIGSTCAASTGYTGATSIGSLLLVLAIPVLLVSALCC